MNETLKRLIPEVKKFWYIPFMVLLGFLFMTLQFKQPSAVSVASVDRSAAFIQETESRIAEMLKNVEGAGECKVTITLASGGKKEYVREEGNVLVITDKDGNESAVVSKENAPEIAGVTIASKGAGSVAVQNRITESVSTVLGVGTNKICVVMLNG